MNEVEAGTVECTCKGNGEHCYLCLYGEGAARELLALAARVQELEQQRIQYGPICLNCGKAEPCMTDEEAAQHGASIPCTFDPAPKVLFERCKQLQQQLADMTARKDAAYLERNQAVAALAKCFPSGVARTAIEGWSEDWHGCVYIDLPTGQVSWHFHDSQADLFKDLPAYTKPWDGHTTEEKYARLAKLKNQEQQVARLRGHFESLDRLIDAHGIIAKALREAGAVKGAVPTE